MSTRGFAPPKIDPCRRFCSMESSNRLSVTSVFIMSPMPVTTAVPFLPMSGIISPIMLPSMRPTVMIAFSAIRPQVSSLSGSMASAMLEKVWVAPKAMACSRLNSTGSIATTRLAPAMAAPWTALMPTPPMPMMTTVSPALTSAE